MAKVTVQSDRYTIDKPLYQWDKDQTLQITGLSLSVTPEIHYTTDAMDKAIVRQATMDKAGIITADIPNSLLQSPYKIRVYVCIYEGKSFKTLYLITIPVEARSKPADYTIEATDNEVYSFNALENLVNNTVKILTDNSNNLIETIKKDNEDLKTTICSSNELLQSQIKESNNQLKGDTISSLNAMSSRIGNIIANNEDTDGNSELIDIRTGIDGMVYDTAGEAVREQIKQNSEKVKNLYDLDNLLLAKPNDFLINRIYQNDNIIPTVLNNFVCVKVKLINSKYITSNPNIMSQNPYNGMWLNNNNEIIRNIDLTTDKINVSNTTVLKVPNNAVYALLNFVNNSNYQNWFVRNCDENGNTLYKNSDLLSDNCYIRDKNIIKTKRKAIDMYRINGTNNVTSLFPVLTADDIFTDISSTHLANYPCWYKVKLPDTNEISYLDFGYSSIEGGAIPATKVYDNEGIELGNLDDFKVDNNDTSGGYKVKWAELPPNADYILAEYWYGKSVEEKSKEVVASEINELARNEKNVKSFYYGTGHLDLYTNSTYGQVINRTIGVEYPYINTYNPDYKYFTNKWYGKKLAFFGDVIGKNGYTLNVGKLLGCSVNDICSSASNQNIYAILIRSTAISNYESIVIMPVSENCSGNLESSGLLDVTDRFDFDSYPNNFYGEVGKIINAIRNKVKDKKIYLINFPYCKKYTTIKESNTALKELSEYYSVPLIDVYSNCGICATNIEDYSLDDTTFNEEGHKLIGDCIAYQMLYL